MCLAESEAEGIAEGRNSKVKDLFCSFNGEMSVGYYKKRKERRKQGLCDELDTGNRNSE